MAHYSHFKVSIDTRDRWVNLEVKWQLDGQDAFFFRRFSRRHDHFAEFTGPIYEMEGEGLLLTNVEEKQDGGEDVVDLFVTHLESLFQEGPVSTDVLEVVNSLFVGCDCVTKVDKFRRLRDSLVARLKAAESVRIETRKDVDCETFGSWDRTEFFELHPWEFDDYVEANFRMFVSRVDSVTIWQLVQLYLAKDPSGKAREFFLYFLFTEPNCQRILSCFDQFPENQPLKSHKLGSPILHTQQIEMHSSEHLFVFIVSKNAVSGTVCDKKRVKKARKRLLRWHSQSKRMHSIWPFFASKTCFDTDS